MSKNQSCTRLFADRIQIDMAKKNLKTNKSILTQFSNVFALAGNEVRLKIIFLLENEGELCPCDLSDILEMSVPAVSQHLRKMKDGSLIEARRDGQTIYYSLISEQLKPLRPFFNQFIKETKKQKL